MWQNPSVSPRFFSELSFFFFFHKYSNSTIRNLQHPTPSYPRKGNRTNADCQLTFNSIIIELKLSDVPRRRHWYKKSLKSLGGGTGRL